MEDAISLPSTSSTAYHTFTLVVPPAAHRSDSDPVRLSTPEFIPRNAVRAERNFTSPHHSPLLPESRPSITPDYPPGPNLTSFPVTSHTSYQNTPSPYFQTPPMYLANVDYRGNPPPPLHPCLLSYVEPLQCLNLVNKETMIWKQYMVHAVSSALFYAFRWDYLLFCKFSHCVLITAGS